MLAENASSTERNRFSSSQGGFHVRNQDSFLSPKADQHSSQDAGKVLLAMALTKLEKLCVNMSRRKPYPRYSLRQAQFTKCFALHQR